MDQSTDTTSRSDCIVLAFGWQFGYSRIEHGITGIVLSKTNHDNEENWAGRLDLGAAYAHNAAIFNGF